MTTIDYLFSDLLVVDAATFLAGPGAATVLGDYGAKVIKIEAPTGDRYRTLKGTYPIDYNWLLTSRNKRSIAIDLQRTEGRAVLHGLVKKADVFLTNFIGTQVDTYELEYERLQKLNPRLIYAHVTGYGTKGPDVMQRSFDATAWWARSGLMDFVREQGVKPAISAPGMGDHATSMSLFSAIMAGLYKREKTGLGSYVTTSLVANGVWSNGMGLQGVLAGTDLSARRQVTGARNPFNHAYETKDGHYVLFTIINATREWPQLAKALDSLEWLEDLRFKDLRTIVTNRHALIEAIQAKLRSMSIAEAQSRLTEHGVTHSHVRPMEQVVNDPQLALNDVIVETGDTEGDWERTIMSPIEIGDEPKKQPQRAPDVGADSVAILQDILEFDNAKIEELIASGAIATEARAPSGQRSQNTLGRATKTR